MAAVLEPASCGGNLPIPAQPWIPVRYGTDVIPVIGAPDPAAATSTLARAVSGLPGLMKAVLDVLAALLLLVVLSPVLVAPSPSAPTAIPRSSGRRAWASTAGSSRW